MGKRMQKWHAEGKLSKKVYVKPAKKFNLRIAHKSGFARLDTVFPRKSQAFDIIPSSRKRSLMLAETSCSEDTELAELCSAQPPNVSEPLHPGALPREPCEHDDRWYYNDRFNV